MDTLAAVKPTHTSVTHVHFSNQHLFVISCVCVLTKKTQMPEIVASVTQNLSFRMCQGCADVLSVVTFELGLKVTQSPSALIIALFALTGPTHSGGCWRLKVIVDMRPYWSIDHTEHPRADEIIASELFITIPPPMLVKVMTLIVTFFLPPCLSIPVIRQVLLIVRKWDVINHFLISMESKNQWWFMFTLCYWITTRSNFQPRLWIGGGVDQIKMAGLDFQ